VLGDRRSRAELQCAVLSLPSRRPARALGVCAAAVVAALLAPSCGSRTGLLLPGPGSDASVADGTARDSAFDGVLASCVPRSCTTSGYDCGTNGDGCGGTLQCGTCAEPQRCGVAGFSECGGGQGFGLDGGPLCTPKTCVQLGLTCGPAADGCGGVLECGICQYPDACGGGGVHGQCGNPLPCTNLCLQQVACPNGGTTTVTGTVVAGTLAQYGAPDPIYNAIVYVPNSAVSAFTPGVQCSQCGGEVTGDPLVATQTAPDGTFTLVNVPVGSNIPLVIQLGRWRRQITIPSVAACATTTLSTTLTRMPRNQTEGDIPLIAIATGEADQTECVLLKMGIDQAEFTVPSANGRVQFYVDNGSTLATTPPAAETLYSSESTLAEYDMVVLPCVAMPVVQAPSDQQNMIDYTTAGGRIFATHYSYAWLDNDAPFSNTANWTVPGNPNAPDTLTATIDTSFVEGQSLATFLQDVGALSGPNEIALTNVRDDVASINPPTAQFITAPGQVLQLSFFTPVGQAPSTQCGRVVFTDFHVSGNANAGDAGLSNGTVFPEECSPDPLTPQEKALEFMLFDLASCVPPAPQNCTPLTCADQKINCGPAGDGCGTEIMCGTCTSPDTCGGGGVYGQCGYPDGGACTPRTCAELGYDCGDNGDGCGAVIHCGTCAAPQICGGGGKPSVCGT
jgi:hypothetical protein